MAVSAFAKSVTVARAFMLHPEGRVNRRVADATLPRPEPYNTYRDHSSRAKLPLKGVTVDREWHFAICALEDADRDATNDRVRIGVGVDWTLDGDTSRLKPWPYISTSFEFRTFGWYVVSRGKLIRFTPID